MTRFYTENIDHEWLQTRSGGQFFPRDPDPFVIDPKDLAVALSRLPRFSGHTREFYSVAQHSMFVANLLEREPVVVRLAGLLHDAEEAYSGFGDLQAPIRGIAGSYRRVKMLVDQAVEIRFDLPRGILQDERIRRADLIALATEKRDLLEEEPAAWRRLPEPAERMIQPWPMQRAAKAYMSMLHNLSRRWQEERAASQRQSRESKSDAK